MRSHGSSTEATVSPGSQCWAEVAAGKTKGAGRRVPDGGDSKSKARELRARPLSVENPGEALSRGPGKSVHGGGGEATEERRKRRVLPGELHGLSCAG